MQFFVLGPLEAHEDRGAVAVGGGRQRALLGLLLVHVGEVVSRDRLIDELWSGEPPASASQSLDAYLSRLRRAFREAGANGVLITRAPGYALQAAGTDAARFESLVRDGRAALAAGEVERGVALLTEALALWRGPAYAEFVDETWARAEAGRLEELRLAATEDRIEAELVLGRHAALVAELEVLAAEHPTRERLIGQLMLALYRSGRQADALAVYRAARRALVDDLGLEPGRELRDLEAAVLVQDASLDLPREPRAQPPTAPGPPTSRRHWHPALLGGVAAAATLAVAIVVVAAGGGSGARGAIAGDGAGAIDPRTGRVEVSVHVGSGPAGIASSSGRVWVTDGADGTVTRIDVAAGHVDQTIPVRTSPAGIAAGAGAIWVTNSLDGSVSRIDPELARVVQTIQVGRRPVALAVGGGRVWVADSDGAAVVPLDAYSGLPRTTVRLTDSPRGVAFGLGSVWVTAPRTRRLLRIDPRDGSITDEIGVGGGAGPVAVGAGAVWVVNSLDGTLSRIDPATDDVTSTVTTGQAPTAVAASSSGVWVADAGSGELVSVDPRTGAVRRHYQVGAAPAAVTLVGATPWVAAGVPIGAAHRGGTLRVAYSPFATLDPAQPSDVHPAIWRATGDGLVALVEDSGAAQLVPDLAIAMPQPTDGGLTYTFHLRRGLRYWTGVPVRASDVRRELERLFGVGTDLAGSMAALRGAPACAQRPAACDLSAGVMTDDRARTIVFHLSRPDPELLFKLALPAARPVPPGTPRTLLAAQPVPSTGPYRVAAFEHGRRLLLVRNASFHEWSRAAQPDGFPDRIEIAMEADPQARVQAVLAGRSDAALEVASANLTPLRTRFASQLHLHSQPHTSFLTFNVRRPPFDDVRARQALNLASDRAALAWRFGGPGLSTPACQVLPPNFPGHEDYCPWTRRAGDGRWHGPDLRRARALVRATGTESARITFLTHRGDDIGTSAAPAVMTALRAIGYRARAVIVSDAEFGREIGAGRWNISDGDSIADYPSPDQFFSFLTCASLTNGGGFCDRPLDRLVARADRLQLDDPATAQALWARADRRAVDLAPWAPMVSNSSVELLSQRTGHFTLDANSQPQIDQLWVR
jgi:peptide/nickel transport system substrate-binding protein